MEVWSDCCSIVYAVLRLLMEARVSLAGLDPSAVSSTQPLVTEDFYYGVQIWNNHVAVDKQAVTKILALASTLDEQRKTFQPLIPSQNILNDWLIATRKSLFRKYDLKTAAVLTQNVG